MVNSRWTMGLAVLVLANACQCGGGQTTPVDGRLVVEPTSLDFGRQAPGSETRLALGLTNTGTATLEVAYLAPASPGSDVGTLSLQTNARATPEVLVSLVGHTAQPCAPRTCAELASACGQHLECGTTVDCGACSSGVCVAHRCEVGADAGAGDGGAEDAGAPDGGPVDAGAGDGGVDAGTGADGGAGDAGADAGWSVDPSRRYVFVTSSSWTGDLGGLAGADARCTSAATAGRLPGAYRAILIADGQVLDQRVPDGGPWYRVDGQLAFQDLSEVLSAPRVPVSVDEHGAAVTGYGLAWTGVIQHGRVSGSTCGSWTSSGAGGIGKAGDVTAATSNWYDYNGTGCSTFDCGPSCSTPLHLYCLQQ